jgi:hypothetical protein
MEHEGSPVINEVRAATSGNPTDAMRPEERTVSSSSDDSSDTGRESATDT